MTKTISSETKAFIKRWNASKSNVMRERLIINQLVRQFLNADLVRFLDEFTSQIIEQDKRIKLLLFCRKLLLQTSAVIDLAHYRAFQEQYDFEIANDTTISGLTWINEELNFIKEVKDVEELFEPFDRRRKLGEPNVPIQNVPTNGGAELMKLEEILELFDISKSTFDRWRVDGFPCDKVGKKLYANREAALAWMNAKKPNKIQFCISRKANKP